VHVDPMERPSGRVGCYDRDPYHYSFAEIWRLAEWCGLDCKLIGAWGVLWRQVPPYATIIFRRTAPGNGRKRSAWDPRDSYGGERWA
jgi:hypothetical protein